MNGTCKTQLFVTAGIFSDRIISIFGSVNEWQAQSFLLILCQRQRVKYETFTITNESWGRGLLFNECKTGFEPTIKTYNLSNIWNSWADAKHSCYTQTMLPMMT